MVGLRAECAFAATAGIEASNERIRTSSAKTAASRCALTVAKSASHVAGSFGTARRLVSSTRSRRRRRSQSRRSPTLPPPARRMCTTTARQSKTATREATKRTRYTENKVSTHAIKLRRSFNAQRCFHVKGNKWFTVEKLKVLTLHRDGFFGLQSQTVICNVFKW